MSSGQVSREQSTWKNARLPTAATSVSLELEGKKKRMIFWPADCKPMTLMPFKNMEKASVAKATAIAAQKGRNPIANSQSVRRIVHIHCIVSHDIQITAHNNTIYKFR